MQPVTWQHSLQNSLGVYLPSILGALAILLIGWLVALLAAAATRRGLGALRTNERLTEHTRSSMNFERIAGRIVFWTILLLAVIGMFSVLDVQGISNPLSQLASTVLLYLPRLLLAALLALLAWIVATIVRTVVNKALGATSFDERLSRDAEMQPLSATMGNVAYWLVLLLFLPAIVAALQIEGLMAPLSNMTATMLAMLPNIFAAVLIGVIGWIIAKVVRGLVTNLLAATGVDRFSQQHEGTRGLKLSQLGGTLAFILVIVPTLIAALDALRIQAISAPLTRMLDIFLQAIPNILAAAAILLIAWFLGRFVADLVTRLLANLGFDRVPERIGMGHAFASTGDESTMPTTAADNQYVTDHPGVIVVEPGHATPRPARAAGTPIRISLSELAGRIALFFIMLFATVEAAALLGFAGVHDLLAAFIAFGADVLLGLVIFVVGYWLANLAADAIQRANRDNAVGLARIARVAILGLVIAMGLRAMGIADEIVNLAFGLVLGAVAVATALAFGLGGREAAGQVTQRWARQYIDRRPPSQH
ncbi:MAG: mechanosensitive ion channel [Lysobacter sp.]|nr:mechanosensitive ion channel [Lysobacter sp.]MDQ3269373.1 mechanosensitive ion channel [Pseudomonadota bacterium]